MTCDEASLMSDERKTNRPPAARKLTMSRYLKRWLNRWSPFQGSGIRVRRISPDFREVDIEMAHCRWNTNRNETHFGGSLFAMTDGMYMMILMENLGPDYVVWDQSASIRFRRPARSAVRAEFRLSEEQIDAVRRAADTQTKVEPTWTIDITDCSGEVVAVVERTMSVKRRQEG
jgi:acyl-coenzyme A thioesterase PaaI-like protein